jgi:hypothetical protein
MRDVFVALMLCSAVRVSALSAQDRPFSVGRVATTAEIRRRDISVAPDGRGLPPGRGTVTQGSAVYAVQCAMCHGDKGVQSAQQIAAQHPALVGGVGTLTGPSPVLTIGSYWPYATTVWDYIHRAMPYPRPGSLTASQVYAVTAYLLYLNHVLPANASLDATSLPVVRMPNRDGFVLDQRPDVRSPH